MANKLPKSVTHTSLFLVVAGILMYSMWLSSPSDEVIAATQDKETKQQETQNDSVVDKVQMLDQTKMFQIAEVLPKGYLVLEKLSEKRQINHPRFKTLDQKGVEKIQNFFVGKFIHIADQTTVSQIELPLELYDPACFGNTSNQQMTQLCPIVLNP